MSYFYAPIAKYTDAKGKIIPGTTRPALTCGLKQVFQLITSNRELQRLTQLVRQAEHPSELKKQLLPYVTPCGTFDYRRSDRLQEASGLVVVDVDGLASEEEAERLRDALFDDVRLRPALCFVSPGGKGVKAFIPFRFREGEEPQADIVYHTRWAMAYVQALYPLSQGEGRKTGVDPSGKDVVRACFLCHDPHARMREAEENN